jgi:protoporphyrinogen oxidase
VSTAGGPSSGKRGREAALGRGPGGGLSGAAAAWSLASAGWPDVAVVERGPAIGGLAGSFEVDGRFYPLGYHHILRRDATLLFFLHRIGALPSVRWRKIHMLFEANGRLYDLARPFEMARFPMGMADKARLARLMARAWRQRDWRSWQGRDAASLLDAWGGPGVREALFEPLTRLKFDLPCREVSAAWIGERLRYREGSLPLGYLPETNWTTVLCQGVGRLLHEAGVRVFVDTPVERVETRDGRVVAVEAARGRRFEADLFVSTVPTPVYARLLPDDRTADVSRIRYTALLSLVCATAQRLPRDFYWLNLSSLSHTAGGLFALSSLNPTIGAPGETTLNFVTHLPGHDSPLFRLPEADLMERYRADFRSLFGLDLETSWARLSRIPLYSPVFDRDYRNPPPCSSTYENVRFAGTYRTYPSVASTGTALQSGLDCAESLLAERGEGRGLAGRARAFDLGRGWRSRAGSGYFFFW